MPTVESGPQWLKASTKPASDYAHFGGDQAAIVESSLDPDLPLQPRWHFSWMADI
ncbi:hypothetical protein [Methylobacterium oxalidis]|uniref:hypothetical protein n=1 Tax=Methylobacterium oxalidis TaxID=944322 RepID=UPI00147848E1|nr:hypothetical protein [Methylobacterium oxalidis]